MSSVGALLLTVIVKPRTQTLFNSMIRYQHCEWVFYTSRPGRNLRTTTRDPRECKTYVESG